MRRLLPEHKGHHYGGAHRRLPTGPLFHGRSGYSQIRGVEGVYSWFTHISTLEGIFPIYLMNATGPEGACTFLENGRCSVYEHAPGCAGSTRLRHFPAHAAGILYFTSAWTAMPATSPGDGPW